MTGWNPRPASGERQDSPQAGREQCVLETRVGAYGATKVVVASTQRSLLSQTRKVSL